MTKRIGLVTGGNRGIGFETCRSLAQRGIQVVLTARDTVAGRQAAAELQAEGLDVSFAQLDVSSAESVQECAAGLHQRSQLVTILVNNAAVYAPSPISRLSEAEFMMTLQVNLLGAWRTATAFLPNMHQLGYGRIINVSSGYGQVAQADGPKAGAYGISKAALNVLTRQLANELRDNIKVNALDPGWVATRMGGSAAPTAPKDAAEMIAWLATLPAEGPSGSFFYGKEAIEW